MKARVLHLILVLSVAAALSSQAPIRTEVPSPLSITAAAASGSVDANEQIRPIKKRVGRAVTSTMHKIHNPWFVVSQIAVPLCAFIFSLIYIRRYRRRRAAANAIPPRAANEANKNADPSFPGGDGG